MDPLARAEDARGDLGLDREASLAERQRAEELRAHRLVAGHDVRDPAVVEDVGRHRDGLVPHHVPEAERRLRRPGARAEDDVSLARDERLEDVGEVGGAVLEVGVEDRGELLCRVLQRRANGRALAEVPLVVDDLHVRRATRSSSSSSRVPSVEPSSTITSSRLGTGSSAREGVVDRRLDRRALVEHGHEDGEATGHGSSVRPRRPTSYRGYGVGGDAAEQELAGRSDDRVGRRVGLQRERGDAGWAS